MVNPTRQKASTDLIAVTRFHAGTTRKRSAEPVAARKTAVIGLEDALEEIDPKDICATGKITRPPEHRPEPVERTSLLQKHSSLDDDEVYGEEERLLSEFVRLHPVLSLESASKRTMQLCADMVAKFSIPQVELEVIPKSHDDRFLSPPGESDRPCALQAQCVCVWLARWRYGAETSCSFVAREFLTPKQESAFLARGTLPKIPGKCLVCTR